MRVPKFRTEAEEAAWWDRNREALDREFAAAIRSGKAKRLTRERLLERIRASQELRAISIRLPQADLNLAREQAERKGLPYQTYLKSLIHEALRRDAGL